MARLQLLRVQHDRLAQGRRLQRKAGACSARPARAAQGRRLQRKAGACSARPANGSSDGFDLCATAPAACVPGSNATMALDFLRCEVGVAVTPAEVAVVDLSLAPQLTAVSASCEHVPEAFVPAGRAPNPRHGLRGRGHPGRDRRRNFCSSVIGC